MPSPFPRPCLECGKLTKFGSRCELCAEERNKVIKATTPKRVYPNKPKRQHYTGDYQRRARAVRLAAKVCHLCGDSARFNDPWTADHLIPGDPRSPLLPAHRSCNSRRQDKPLTDL